jgi:hypothetical protein
MEARGLAPLRRDTFLPLVSRSWTP